MPEKIVLLDSSHIVSDEMYGVDERLYKVSFVVNDAFIPIKSHAAEAEMLQVYSFDGITAHEGDMPYISLLEDDTVYSIVALFEKDGHALNALEVIPLSGKFLFKAKMEYYGDMMYFYGHKRCGDDKQYSGLCLVYPKEYVGTEYERLLMQVLDEAAETYNEERINEDTGILSGDRQETVDVHHLTVNKVVKAARIIKRIRMIAGLVAIIGILGFLLALNLSEKHSTHHIVQLNGGEKIISRFSPEEQKEVFEAFNIIIPSDETDAHLVSFMKDTRYDKITSYIIEIDGVDNAAVFYAANSGRKLGKSVNEMDTRNNDIKYYITYHVRILNDNDRNNTDKNSETYKCIEELFDTLYFGE